MHESNQKSILNDMIDNYGSSSYNISGIENSDLHFVTNDTNTKSYTISQEQNVTFDDKTFHYIIASKNFFEYANYRIVDVYKRQVTTCSQSIGMIKPSKGAIVF